MEHPYFSVDPRNGPLVRCMPQKTLAIRGQEEKWNYRLARNACAIVQIHLMDLLGPALLGEWKVEEDGRITQIA